MKSPTDKSPNIDLTNKIILHVRHPAAEYTCDPLFILDTSNLVASMVAKLHADSQLHNTPKPPGRLRIILPKTYSPALVKRFLDWASETFSNTTNKHQRPRAEEQLTLADWIALYDFALYMQAPTIIPRALSAIESKLEAKLRSIRRVIEARRESHKQEFPLYKEEWAKVLLTYGTFRGSIAWGERAPRRREVLVLLERGKVVSVADILGIVKIVGAYERVWCGRV